MSQQASSKPEVWDPASGLALRSGTGHAATSDHSTVGTGPFVGTARRSGPDAAAAADALSVSLNDLYSSLRGRGAGAHE